MIPETLNSILVLGALLYFSFAVLLAITDYMTGLLPDKLTLSMLWSGLIFHTMTYPDKLVDAIYGAVCGYLTLWVLFWGFFWLSKREGLGYGDFKLLAAIGAWNGWQSLPLVLVIASVTGIVAFIWLTVSQKQQTQQIPFGPFLVIAGWGDFISQI